MTSPLFDPTLFNALHAAASATPVLVTPQAPAGLGGEDVLAASKALTAEATAPGMTRPFLPHQAAAFLYVVASILRWGGAMLGHDMGLGKTQVFLAAIAQRLDQARSEGASAPYAILVGPPVGKGGYMGDLQAAFPGLRFAHLHGRKVHALPAADIYYLSDDALTLRAWLTAGQDERKRLIPSRFAQGATILVRDEIHRDKGAQAKPTTRAKVMLAVANALRANGAPVIGVTGTLLTNRPVEAFLPLQIVGGEELVKAVTPGASRASTFLYRYCGAETTRFGTSFNGMDMERMEELHDALRRSVYCRIEKSDLGDSLPHGGWIITPMALDNHVMARYRRLSAEFLATMREERGQEAAVRMARAEVITRMNALREEAGVAKGHAAAEYISDLVDQGRKVVAFYEHHKVFVAMVDALVKRGITVGIVNGKVTGDNRLAEIEAFQNGDTQVLLAQTQAAGIGCTLTSAADAVFVQLPWSAGSLKQAADRILRADDISRARALRGEAVTWHVLTAHEQDGKPTMDSIIWQVLEMKAHVCDAVNAGRAITMPEGTVQELALEAWLDSQA